MRKIIFPRTTTPRRYYDVHPAYLLEIFRKLGFLVEFCDDTTVGECAFGVGIDSNEAIFDYWDLLLTPDDDRVCFKFHFSDGIHTPDGRLFPFAPVSFYDWDQYFELKNKIKYVAGDVVISAQRPYCDAKARRVKLQATLKSKYGGKAMTAILPQESYWEAINGALVHVFAPGARADMLDRGHIQYLAFGCCTISPKIINILPFWEKLEPNIHYIECGGDYSNVIQLVEWCRSNKDACIEIGRNAQNLFETTCTPNKLIEWIDECLK